LVRDTTNKISGLVIRRFYLAGKNDCFFHTLFQFVCNDPVQRAFLPLSITTK